MNRVFINKGEKVIYNNQFAIITRIIDIDTVSIEEVNSNISHTVNVAELSHTDEFNQIKEYDLNSLSEKEWELAKKRFDIIKPILSKRGDLNLISTISKKSKVSIPSIYRWLKKYDDSGLVSSLANKKRLGGAGKGRLNQAQEDIINDKINSVYLNSKRKSVIKTIREIKLQCDELGIKSPHDNTIRNRIKNLSEELKIRKRFGIQEAKYKFEPLKGSFPGANKPLAVVQIDHTPVDIILVDKKTRNPFMRPWLTLAMDIYSRVVVGFYLSYETPGALGTGMCIAHSILPKEAWLHSKDIQTEWPIWGVMDKIHTDNAKEFKGNMLKKAAINYGIELELRPIGATHYGGHIERLLGTFSKEIHDLPGTTFSNVAERKRYQSEKNASFTIDEFEKWLTIYITKIYHQRTHSALNMSPLDKFKEGTIGSSNAIGIPPRINEELKVRLDFMPYVERSVQEYGIVIDHIYYYADILRNFIHDTDNDGKPVKHIFKRDPRDISIIYFYEPNNREYYEIPYRDTSLPPMSIWEYREIIRKLKDRRIKVNEHSIFEAFRELNEIETRAIRNTKKQKRREPIFTKPTPHEKEEIEISEKKQEEIKPFEDIDDEAFDE